jgi:hypothetical protein
MITFEVVMSCVLASARDSSGKPANKREFRNIHLPASPLEARGRLGTDSPVPLRLAGHAA